MIITVIPINLTGVAVSSTAIYLSWSLPAVQGISISHYIMEIVELETSHSWTFHAAQTRANIISLHPYFTYECRVAAVGNATTYPFTSTITVITHQSGN